ncbi:MAG: CHASE2 domain-containing protein [Terriglobales bacterium]
MRLVRQLGTRLAAAPPRRVSFAISLVVTLAGLAVYVFSGIGGNPWAGFSLVQNIELRSLDARFGLRGARPPDVRIVIVDIDEKTLQRMGAYPIARSAYAQLVDRLHADGASLVAFDVTFPTPEKNSAVEALAKLEGELGSAPAPVRERIARLKQSSDNDRLLAESMKRAGNVLLGHVFLDAERAEAVSPQSAEAYFNTAWGAAFPQVLKVKAGRDFDLGQAWARGGGQVAQAVEANIPPLAEAARSFGFINNNPDSDGAMRRAVLLMRYQNADFFPSLAFQVVREYERVPDQELKAFINENGLERIEFGSHVLRPRSDSTVLINYAGPFGTYPHYSMVDVIEGKVPAATFRDKIVLLGPTALGIGDIRSTPFPGPTYMGVEIHANIIDNLLRVDEPGRTFLRRGNREEMADLAVILLFGLGLGWWFGRTRPALATLSAALAVALFLALVVVAFGRWGMWLSFIVPAGTLLANYAGVTSFRMIFEEREKRKVRRTFQQYVSPGVIRLLEQDPGRFLRRGGEMKELTIMFADIRGFTSLSEGLTPDELVTLLNEYLGEMTEILFRRWGTLDKYIGDAIMAFWGSPFPQEDHAQRACSAALDMCARLEELNLRWREEGRPTLAIGVGLNTGPVNVGNMGSDRRLAWTVMGDNVNLASRLEGLTKEYGVRVVVSESTWQQLAAHFVGRDLDRIRVKGKQQPVGVYELLDFRENAEQHRELLAGFEEAMRAYRQREWQEAVNRFETLLRRSPQDGPSQLLLRRSREFLAEAPAADWDGVYVMKTK